MYLRCRISSTVDLSYLSKVAPPGKKQLKLLYFPKLSISWDTLGLPSLTFCNVLMFWYTFCDSSWTFQETNLQPPLVATWVLRPSRRLSRSMSSRQIWLLKKNKKAGCSNIFPWYFHKKGIVLPRYVPRDVQISPNFPRYFTIWPVKSVESPWKNYAPDGDRDLQRGSRGSGLLPTMRRVMGVPGQDQLLEPLVMSK